MFVRHILVVAVVGLLLCSCDTREEGMLEAGYPNPVLLTDDGELLRQDPALGQALAALEHQIVEAMQAEHIPGLAAAVVKNGRLVWIKTLGVRDVSEPANRIDAHTVFRLASLSKGFAPALTAQLVKDKQLHWDDPIVRYLPELQLQYPAESKQILSLRHVLSQASGFPYQTFSNRLNTGESYYFIKPDLKGVAMTHAPGVYFNYQNVVYSLSGDVLEAVSGACYDSLLHHRLLRPLGMYDASSGLNAMLATPNKAMPHQPAESGSYRIPLHPNYYTASPAAGLNASITDMAYWLRALEGYAPGVLDAATLEEMFCIQVPFEPYEPSARQWRPYSAAGYGLGMRIVHQPPHTIVYHGGMVNGYRNELALCPEEALGICILTNSFSGSIQDISVRFFQNYWAASQTKASGISMK